MTIEEDLGVMLGLLLILCLVGSFIAACIVIGGSDGDDTGR